MSTFNALSRMMQRPPTTPPPSTTPSQPPPPSKPPSTASTSASALALTSSVGSDETSSPTHGTNPFSAASIAARGAGGGAGAQHLQRPPMGARGNSSGLASSPVGAGVNVNSAANGMASLGLAAHHENERLGEIAQQQAGVKQKQIQYDFRYDDTDTLLHELEEFYPYVEMNGLEEEAEVWSSGEFEGGAWSKASKSIRQRHISHLLESLEHRSSTRRLEALQRLTYLIHGNFMDTDGEEEQLHWICENVRMVREADGMGGLMVGLGEAVKRHDGLANAIEPTPGNRQSFSVAHQTPGDAPVSSETKRREDLEASIHSGNPQSHGTLAAKMDECNSEIGMYLGVMYFVVEGCRRDEGFGDELMTLKPPLPVFLLNLVASLREKTAKGFPVKKLLLLVWKTLLACFGGLREARKCVALQREMAGLKTTKADFTKITPVGLSSFKKDIQVKYPTFEGGTAAALREEEKLAEAVQPIPVRSSYHSSVEEGLPSAFVSRTNRQDQANPQQQVGSLPQPGTPAPSPPPTPPLKPKKQQYQTDQTKPFVFPFTRAEAGGPTRLVPFAIDEANKLYGRHMHVSLGLWQLSQVRTDFIREESGLGDSGLIGFEKSAYDEDMDDLEDKAWEEYQLEDWKYEEKEEQFAMEGNTAGVASVNEARQSLKRLYRVELVYRSIVPYSQSIVIVLLKLLLATVTANANGPNAGQPLGSPTQEAPTEQDDKPPPTLEEVDIIRHREITAKAVSAIVLLMLKWFKASHILKFQHFSALLIDSNCLLLVLKMFGFQELMSTVSTKNDWEDQNFFRYCHLNFSPSRSNHRPEDKMLGQPKITGTRKSEGGDEIELSSEYSWRNFFYAINFMRIVHQLTKQRPARISLLVQYKSTQILKRMLRVPHPMLQLQILKVIKSQVPFCGRKWRQSNMKTITAVYLNCSPELRDDWLAATDIDADIEEANSAELALRSLVRFYHQKRYSQYASIPGQDVATHGHRRANSSVLASQDDAGGNSSGFALLRGDSDVFPPNKTLRRASSGGLGNDQTYNVDNIMGSFLYEYEDLIGEVLGTDGMDETRDGLGLLNSPRAHGPAMSRSDPAWMRLDELMRRRGMGDDEVISDSESVVSVGELGSEARFNDDDFDQDFGEEGEGEGSRQQRERRLSGNENTWAHISPALSMLPKSPNERPRRRSSSGDSPLRPVISGDLNWFEQAIEDEGEPGPMPIEEGTEDEIQRGNMAVDEVEEFFNV